MSDAPNAGDAAQSNKPSEQPTPAAAPTPAPTPTTAPVSEEPDASQVRQDAEIDQEVTEAMSAMSTEDLAELTLSSTPAAAHEPAAGVQLGRIVAIQGDDVFIDLGEKSQGVLTRDQFKPEEKLAVGEPIEVVIDHFDRSSGLLILMRKGAVRSADWDRLKPGDLLEGRVVGLNKGGLEVKFKDVMGFMPASQVDVMHVKDISIFLNEFVRCEVIEINRRAKRLTVSRRKVLEKERGEKRAELLEELAVDQLRKGVVGNLTDFGAFVDMGGVDGLIHISDMSWGQIKHPSEVLKTGDVVEVKVLRIQDDKGGKMRISLGLKQAQPDPWDGVEQQFPLKSSQRVRVVRLADFGAFAELSEGIEGLIPVSEMSWGRINRPADVVKVGDLVDVCVIRVNAEEHRIALSIRQAQPDPWAEVVDSYQPDTTVDGKVTRVVDFGAFVELTAGVEGLIHISELADRHVKACTDVVKPGQEVKARILSVDPKSRRIALSLKPSAQAFADDARGFADAGSPQQPKRKAKKLRGGLAAGWDWAGAGLGGLAGLEAGGDRSGKKP